MLMATSKMPKNICTCKAEYKILQVTFRTLLIFCIMLYLFLCMFHSKINIGRDHTIRFFAQFLASIV